MRSHMTKAHIRESLPLLITFLVLAIAFYGLGYWLIFRLGRATPLMMSVGVAAIVTLLIYRRPLASLGLAWGDSRYQWASYCIPLAIALVSYLLIWVSGVGDVNSDFASGLAETYNLAGWSVGALVLFHFCLSATLTLSLSIPSIVGEEIAWRGLLVTELSKSLSFKSVALITGVLWSMFHWPLMFKGFYGSEHTPLYYQMGLFTLFIVSNSVTMTYLRYKTNSVWSAVLFHASSNVFLQKVFTPFTTVDQHSAWYVDEFGLVVPIVAFLCAIYFWIRANREFGPVASHS